MRQILIKGQNSSKIPVFCTFWHNPFTDFDDSLEPSSGFSLPFLCISRRLDQTWGSLLQTLPHTHTITQIIVRCPSTNDEIMCRYVQVPSKKNSCKIYLCVYNKMNEKEIYKSNLHFLKWMGSLFRLLAILYSVSLMFLIKFNKLTKFGFLFWNLETKM